MSIDELKELRRLSCMTQRDFAMAMGVPLRTYENLENGRSEVRQIHLNAARWALAKALAADETGVIVSGRAIEDVIRKAASNL